eukprot:1903387-Prymnesium_polylepis.2
MPAEWPAFSETPASATCVDPPKLVGAASFCFSSVEAVASSLCAGVVCSSNADGSAPFGMLSVIREPPGARCETGSYAVATTPGCPLSGVGSHWIGACGSLPS